ncbi:beta strand repeat-containing protein [Thalassoglobus sp.]|uniref:beta strand repeat-containing protein n=1 Tax=Thalassoglobus sp. TaxID=2795869 RepID=UPI003AA90BF4
MKWFSRLQHLLSDLGERSSVSKREHSGGFAQRYPDDFVQLYVDRLEERRVLSVTAALIAGELIIEGTDTTEDLAILQISNAGDPGNEVIRIFDTTDITANPIDIVDHMGNSIGDSIVTSQLPNGIRIDMGDQDDEVIMRIPSGFAGADPLQITVDGGGGNDLVTLVDNGNPLFTNLPDDASVTINAETIRFGDENFLLDDVDLFLNGSLQLTEDQLLSTSGIVDISGDVFGVAGNPAESFEVDTDGHEFSVGGSLGLLGNELGDVEITASVISLGDGALSTGDQLYHGAFQLSADANLESTGSGAIEFDTIDGNGHDLTIMTDGDVLFGDTVEAVLNLDVSGAGISRIDADSISAMDSIEFHNQVVVAQDTTLSAVGRVKVDGPINSEAGEFNTLQVQSPGMGGNPALPGSIILGSNAGTSPGGAFGSVTMSAKTGISLHDVTTQNGLQSYTADLITTNSHYVTMGGDFVVMGLWDVQSNSLVETDGGEIDLSAATLSSSNVGITLQLDATDGMNPGGLVTLGQASNASGNLLGLLEINAENVLFTTTNFEVGMIDVVAAEMITLRDVTTTGYQLYQANSVSISGTYATNGGAFTAIGNTTPVEMNLTDDVNIKTDDGSDPATSKVDFSDVRLSASVAGKSLLIHAGTGADVAFFAVDDSGGEFLKNVTITAANEVTLGSDPFTVAGTFQVDNATTVFVTGMFLAGAATITANLNATNTIETNSGSISVTGNVESTNTFTSQKHIKVTGTSQFGADVTASGNIDLADDVTLTGDVILKGDNIDISGDLVGDGVLQHQVTLDGTTSIAGAIGGAASTIGNLNVETGQLDAGEINISGDLVSSQAISTTLGDIAVGGNLDTDSTLQSAGGINITGTSRLGGDVTSTLDQVYQGDVTLAGDVILKGDNIDISGDLVGDGVLQHQVTLDGTTTIAGSIGGAASTIGNLNVETDQLDAGEINISGDMVASQAVSTTLGDIAVGGNLDTDSTLQSAGGINITGTSRLGGDVTSTLDQVYQNDVTLKSDVHFSAEDGGDLDNNAITFLGKLNEDAAATSSNAFFTTTSDVLFVEAAGSLIPIDSLTFHQANDITFDSTVQVVSDFMIATAKNVTLNSTFEVGGNFTQSAGNGTTEFNGTSGAGIGGMLNVTTENVLFQTAVVSTGGNIDIQVAESITFTTLGGLDADAATINLVADTDNNDTGSFIQSAGSKVTTLNETVNAISVSVLGTGDAEIASLNAGTTSGVVTVNVGGEILDATLAETANIIAFGAELTAASGIGAAGGVDDLNTDVARLAFDNSSGELHIRNDGALEVAMVNLLAEPQALGGGTLTANSPLTISMNTLVGGDMTFTAGNSAVVGDDLTIDADVTHTDGDGFIAFVAGDDITHMSGTLSNTGGAVNELRFLADQEGAADGDRGGITQVAGALDAEHVLFVAFDAVDFSTGMNDVETLAADVEGAFTFVEVDTLAIGTVNGVSGIKTQGSHVDIQSGGELTVDEEINTQPGAGGSVTVSAAILNATLTAGAGDITLNGGGLDLVINAAQSTATSAMYSAPRDIIIGAKVSTIAPGANLTFSADTDNDSVGGVHLLVGGQIDSAGTVLIEGADLSTTAGSVESVRVDADGANDQILAVGEISIQPRGSAPANADQILDGQIHSTTGDIDITAKNNILLSADLIANAGNVDLNSAVRLTGASTISAGGTAIFDSTIDDDGVAMTGSALTVTAAGTTQFMGAIGASDAIESLLVDGGGTTEVEADITATGSIQFDDAFVLVNSIAITSNDAGLLFNSTVEGTTAGMEDLTITVDSMAGDVTFQQAVGQSTALGDVIVTNVRDLLIEEAFTADSFVQQDGTGQTTVNGLTKLNGVIGFDVTTSEIDINADIDVVTAALGANVALTSENSISLDATILSGTGSVTLMAGSDVAFTGGISSSAGSVLVEANNDITFEMTALIKLTAGSFTVTADADADQDGSGGALLMKDGALIDAGSGTISLSADEDITLGGLLTTNSTVNAVSIVTTSGGVVDGGDTHLEIVADAVGAVVAIDAVTGIGSGNGLETKVATIDLENSGSGNIEIEEQTALTISNADQVGDGDIAITTVDGSILITNMGVSTNGIGTVLIDANGNDSSLKIDAAITTEDGGITLNADGDITGTANGSVSSIMGNIEIHADAEVNGTGGVDLMDTPVDAGSGTIHVTAFQGVIIGSATTTSAANNAVSILSRDGSVMADVTAIKGQLNLDSATGSTITSDVERVDAMNSTSGDIMVTNSSALDIIGVSQQGSGDVIISSDGTMTILNSGTGVAATTGMVDLDALVAGSDLLVNQDISTDGGEINLFAEGRVASTLGSDLNSSAPASAAGQINIKANTGDVELRGDVIAVGTGTEDAGDVSIESVASNVILTNVDASAGDNAGAISVTAGQEISLTGNLTALGDTSDGSVSLDAGTEILDGNDGSTLISTGDLSLTAAKNIGEIDDFVARTGNAIDAVVTGELHDLSITDAGGEIHLKIIGDLQAASGAIVPDTDGVATLLLQTTGMLDVGTNPGVLDLSIGDLVGLHAGTVLTLPDAGMDVGSGLTGGTLRLSGGTDVIDPAGRELGLLIARDLFLTSMSSGGDTTLNLDVTNLDADLSGAAAGTKLTINNEGDLNANRVVTNDGDIRINNALMQRGDLNIGQIDAGTGDVILDTTANGGALRDLDENELPANTNVDIIAAGLAIRIANNSVTNVIDHTLEVEIDTLAADSDNLAVKILDESGSLTIGTVDGLSGVTITNADSDDVVEVVTVGDLNVNGNVSSNGLADLFLAAGGSTAGHDLNLDADVSKKGSAGNVSLIASDDVTISSTSSVTAEYDSNITVRAGVDVLTPDVVNTAPFSSGNVNGDILMSSGSLIGTDAGTITLQATRDVAITLLNANLDGGGDLGNVVISADDNGLADSTPNGNGEIREVLAGESANIIADNASLSAATGIGVADDINLDVMTVDASNSTVGDVQLFEVAGGGDNNLTVTSISNQNGDVNVQTDDGTLIISGPVSTTGSGNVVLTSGDSDLDGNGDLQIQASVTTDQGSVTLTSEGNHVEFTDAGDVTTTSGRVDVTAGMTDDMGNISQMADSVINAGTAQVEFNAHGQITLGQIVTTNASTQAVTLNADMGVNSVDPPNLLNIDAANGRLVINTDSGVAPIRTTVESLDLSNISTGGVTITETDAINIVRVDQNAAAGIDITSGGTMTLVSGGAGVTGTSSAINLTTEGAGSQIVINSTVQSTSGKITVNAAANVRMGAASSIETAAAELLLIGGNALDPGSVTSGGILMEDGALIDATDARVDLVAKEDIQVGRILTSTDVRLTSLDGAISDAGDSGGVDVVAASLGLDAATGIGDGNSIETSVSTLASRNLTSGGVEIDNTTGALLTIGDFNSTALDATLGPLSGITLAGAIPENIVLSHDGELLIASPVLNMTGGEIDLTSGADFTVQAVVIADINSPTGIVRLNSGADLIVLDTNPGDLAASDIEGYEVIGTAASPVPDFDQGTGGTVYDPSNPDLFNPPENVTDPINFDPDNPAHLAMLPVRFADNVIVRSHTGAITQPVPSAKNIDTPQVLSNGIARITGDFGRNSEGTFIYVVDWDSVFGDDTQIFNSGDPLYSNEEGMVIGTVPGTGPGAFDFDHQYFGNPNPNNPSAPILITISVFDDPNITFFADAGAIDLGEITFDSEAPIPGEGLAGGFVFDVSVDVPQIEAPRVQFSENLEKEQGAIIDTEEDDFSEGVVESEGSRDELILIIQKIGPDGKVEIDQFGRPIQRTLHGADAIERLNDLPELHKRLDFGHWKIFTKEGEDGQMMLVEDVILRDGRPVVGEEGTQDRPPTSETMGDSTGKMPEVNDSPKVPPAPEKQNNEDDDSGTSQIDSEMPIIDADEKLSLRSEDNRTEVAFLAALPVSSQVIRKVGRTLHRFKHFAGLFLGLLK